MPRNARRYRGGLTQSRQNRVRVLQDLENSAGPPDDANQRFNPLYKNTAKLEGFKMKSVKDYLYSDLEESIQLLKSKQANLKNISDDMTWEYYVNNEVRAMTYMSNGKSIKGLTGAIAAYNVFKKRADNLNLTRGFNREQTGFTCGTNTCKERGQKIKEALTVLATFSPDALGSFGVMDVTASAFNWLGKSAYNMAGKVLGSTSKPGYIDADYAQFLGLPPELIKDVNETDEGTELKTLQPSNGSQLNPTSPSTQQVTPTGPSYFTPSNEPITQQPTTKKSWFSWGSGKRTRRRR